MDGHTFAALLTLLIIGVVFALGFGSILYICIKRKRQHDTVAKLEAVTAHKPETELLKKIVASLQNLEVLKTTEDVAAENEEQIEEIKIETKDNQHETEENEDNQSDKKEMEIIETQDNKEGEQNEETLEEAKKEKGGKKAKTMEKILKFLKRKEKK